jgi:hypothetical protein
LRPAFDAVQEALMPERADDGPSEGRLTETVGHVGATPEREKLVPRLT